MKKHAENFLGNLNTEIDVLNLVTVSEIDKDNAFESIRDMIENNQGFNIDIIYFSNAIEYLQKNDNSLKESMNLAAEMCYTCENLTSETLASLLASQNARIEFDGLENEITNWFEALPDFTQVQKRRNRIFKKANN